MNLMRTKIVTFSPKTLVCHSTENKYKWQNPMSVLHPELTNIAPGKIFADQYNVKRKIIL